MACLGACDQKEMLKFFLGQLQLLQCELLFLAGIAELLVPLGEEVFELIAFRGEFELFLA